MIQPVAKHDILVTDQCRNCPHIRRVATRKQDGGFCSLEFANRRFQLLVPWRPSTDQLAGSRTDPSRVESFFRSGDYSRIMCKVEIVIRRKIPNPPPINFAPAIRQRLDRPDIAPQSFIAQSLQVSVQPVPIHGIGLR
jgi:hypothetical protein